MREDEEGWCGGGGRAAEAEKARRICACSCWSKMAVIVEAAAAASDMLAPAFTSAAAHAERTLCRRVCTRFSAAFRWRWSSSSAAGRS